VLQEVECPALREEEAALRRRTAVRSVLIPELAAELQPVVGPELGWMLVVRLAPAGRRGAAAFGRAVSEPAVSHGSAHFVSAEVVGSAMWAPPGPAATPLVIQSGQPSAQLLAASQNLEKSGSPLATPSAVQSGQPSAQLLAASQNPEKSGSPSATPSAAPPKVLLAGPAALSAQRLPEQAELGQREELPRAAPLLVRPSAAASVAPDLLFDRRMVLFVNPAARARSARDRHKRNATAMTSSRWLSTQVGRV
jgi:hypothetical protein